MTTDPQHCPSCQTEYVAGIAACADCGGPLTAGPLGRYAPASAAAPAAVAEAAASGAFDAVLTQLPGARADHAVRALLLEEIPCFVECEGLTRTYQPGSPPTEPFAVTLPVTVRVRHGDLATAREVIASLDSEDLIGEQWSDEELAEAAAASAPAGASSDEGQPPPAAADDPHAGAPEPQRTSMVSAVLIVVVVLGLLLLFGRQ